MASPSMLRIENLISVYQGLDRLNATEQGF